MYFTWLLLVLSAFLESTTHAIPLTLIFLLILFVHKKSADIFVWALVLGLILDILSVQIVGGTSLFYLLFLFFMYLYDRKYEIKTLPFVAIAAFFGSLIYLFIFNNQAIVIRAVESMIVAVMGFMILQYANKENKH